MEDDPYRIHGPLPGLRNQALAVLVVAAASVAGLPASRARATTVESDTPQEAALLQDLLDRSDIPTPPGSMTIHVASYGRKGWSFTERMNGRTEVWVAPPLFSLRFLLNLGHEAIGHGGDFLLDPDLGEMPAYRQAFAQEVGRPNDSWNDPTATGKPGLKEEWADVAAAAAFRGTSTSNATIKVGWYPFKLSRRQYNNAAQTVIDSYAAAGFDPAKVKPRPIPHNYTGSEYCGWQPAMRQHCGRPPHHYKSPK